MKTIKLPDRLFALVYQIVVNAMGEVKRTDPPQKVDDLQEIIYKILLDKPETRESYRKLIWKVWDYLGFITYTTEDMGGEIKYSNFIKSPSPESIRRPAQQIFKGNEKKSK